MRTPLAALCLLLTLAPLSAQSGDPFFLRPTGEVLFPLDTYRNSVTGAAEALYAVAGFTAGSTLEWRALPWLVPYVKGGYGFVPYAGSGSLQFAEGALGVGFKAAITDRISAQLSGQAGLAELFLRDLTGASYTAAARLGADYRVAPAVSLSASGGFATYFGSKAFILSAATGSLSFTFDLSALAGEQPRVAVDEKKLEPVFPSLYAYYDDHSFGTVRVVNREDAAITNIRVSFNAARYMDQPKVCGQFTTLAAGGSVVVPVKALFTNTVLNVTQGLEAKGEVVVRYNYLGSEREVREPIDFRMHHRNAITWSDDRRAAAFVSATNPAALWFARFATGVVNDRLRADLNKPLQYAMGLFEAERLYGLNYVLVPANDYSVKHEIKDYIDSVQFPHQTIANRGGDCSDLAILFASLMQSVGVEAAFITAPGHIFAAFDTGLDEATARATFSDPGLLIFREGKVWVPIEVTMVKDGFLKAWRVGAKEWIDNVATGSAAFYPLPECWAEYPATAFPDVNPRFVLPETTALAVAVDTTLDRYVSREIVPQVDGLKAKLASAPADVRANEEGVLYGSFGLLSEAWKSFSSAAETDLPGAWTNLGNVAYLQKNYRLAVGYFQYALTLDPKDDAALLGVARCQYELEDFDASDLAYAQLKARNPALAGKFGYLGSVFGGAGRAFSLADRFASTTWVRPALSSVASGTGSRPGVPLGLPRETDAVPPRVARSAIALAPPRTAPHSPTVLEPLKAAHLWLAVSQPSLEAEPATPVPDLAPEPPVALAPTPVATPEAKPEVEPEPATALAIAPAAAAPAPQPEPEPVTQPALVPEPATALALAPATTAPEPTPAAEPSPAPVPVPEAPVAESAPQLEPEPVTQPALVPEPATALALVPATTAPEPIVTLPPVAELQWTTITSGFSVPKRGLGQWDMTTTSARQLDSSQFFAKVAVAAASTSDPLRYSVWARSLGTGWVGVGFHLPITEGESHRGYGEGDSWLVWLTRDPVHFAKNPVRLQVYHSVSDVKMDLVAEVPVSAVLKDWNKLEANWLPDHTLEVWLNGAVALRVPVKGNVGAQVVFRALDRAEFKDFLVEAKR